MKNFLLFVFILFLSSIGFAQTKNTKSANQNDIEKFQYKPEKSIPAGTVLHYVKTNLDGSKPEFVSQYIASADVMESFKFHPKSARAGLVIAEMDWKTFSVRSLKSYQVFAGGERKLFATLNFDAAKKGAEVLIPSVRRESEFLSIVHLPFHIYNFDFGSLNFAFAHLKNLKKSFVIGIADPTFKTEGAMMEYRGEAAVSYVGEEKRNDVTTRKYKADGAGLKNRGGFIWVNKSKNYIEDIEIEFPDNPEWTSFKFKLLKTEKMSRAEWGKFMTAQF